MMRLVLLMLMGCAVADPGEPELEVAAAIPPGGGGGVPLPGETGQGRNLLGDLADPIDKEIPGSNHISSPGWIKAAPNASGTGVNRVTPGPTGLIAWAGSQTRFANDDPRFQDLELELDGDTNLRIVDMYLDGSATRYVLELVNLADNSTTEYCSGAALENGTIPTRGSWTRSGVHNSDNRITFSCPTGVITKCIGWGYPPGNAPTGTTNDPWLVHQACTRMARADYCGTGQHHTFDETTIVIRDRINGGMPNWVSNDPVMMIAPDFPAPPNQFWLEALWDEDGAQCASRDRWASMPAGFECPGLPDPRVSGSGGVFCEDFDVPNAMPRFYNSSKVGQLELKLWLKKSGGNIVDALVTVRGQSQDNWNGFEYAGQLGLLMRNPPGSIPLPGEEEAGQTRQLAQMDLYVATAGTDRLSSRGRAGYSLATDVPNPFEGYVYLQGGPGRIPLNLYRNGTDYVTSTEPPSEDFDFVQQTGWIDGFPTGK